ncbi:hypothetical protein [Kitasatospora cineracea]|uniref:hypothetical protein n=1 Tax=Kitasatospora cineracea TaxID=88074 RepID=UPI0037FE7C7F
MAVLRTAVLVGAVLLTGLTAGLLYSYACSVMPGLAQVGDRAAFEDAWVRWNLVRALAATAAFGCLTWGLALSGRHS